MVFTQGPLSLGESFGHEDQMLQYHFSPMETAAHLGSLATVHGLGRIFRNSDVVRFVQGGVVKTFRCADSSIGRIKR